jgi:hypothetical protein
MTILSSLADSILSLGEGQAIVDYDMREVESQGRAVHF